MLDCSWPRMNLAHLIVSWSLMIVCTCSGQVKTESSSEATNDLFGREAKNQTEVFVASDVPDAVKKGIQDTLDVAVKEWGSSGRLEYWVLGTDRKAAEELADLFCKRRVKHGHMTRQKCQADRTNKDHGFLQYQALGAKALSLKRPHGSAGHNGGAQWGFHNMTSSLPLGFAGVLNVAGEEEQITILHEYWHSVQNAFIQTTDHKRRRELMGPAWFVEGSAVAMAELTAARLWRKGSLRRWKNSTNEWRSLEQRMTQKMKSIQEQRKDCPAPLPDSYEDSCRQLAYDGGAWAVAYLLNRAGDDVLLKTFHPNVEKLGWEKAFKKTFGQSSKEFEIEFIKFLDQPVHKQIRILQPKESRDASKNR